MVAKCLVIFIEAYEWINEIPTIYYLLSSEITAKGTGLGESIKYVRYLSAPQNTINRMSSKRPWIKYL